MRHIQTEGLILYKKSYGEGHEMLFILSKAMGKIKVLAKGSRKLKSKFLGHLEILNICKFQIYKGPNSMILTECELKHPFAPKQLNLQQINCALKISRLLHQSIMEEEIEPKFYLAIKQSIKELAISEKPFIDFLKTSTKLIKLLGYFSEFNTICPNCLNTLKEEENLLLLENAAINCNKCKKASHPGRNIEKKYLHFLDYLHKLSEPQHKKLHITADEEVLLQTIIDAYFNITETSYSAPKAKLTF